MTADLTGEFADEVVDRNHSISRNATGGICLVVLVIILIAGLWPFHAPANQVKWLAGADGLQFGRYGSAVTSAAFQGSGIAVKSGTLEIWLEPAIGDGKGTILSFDQSNHPGEPFSLQQMGDALILRRNNVDSEGVSRTAFLFVGGVFKKNEPVFLTVTLDSESTSVFVNGILAKVFPLSGAWNDFTGRMLLANSPTARENWSGKIFGLAFFSAKLTAPQVEQGYKLWTTTNRVAQAQLQSALALYLFNERSGTIVHNQFETATELQLPSRYFILRPRFLAPVSLPYHSGLPRWGYWKDTLINVGGFVPVGFFLLYYLVLVGGVKKAAVISIVAGLFLSLTIETLQWFLPTRDSDMTDVITNTLGTAIGVFLFQCQEVQQAWAKVMNHSIGIFAGRRKSAV